MNRIATDSIVLFVLHCLQWMEDGPHGLSGLNALPPVTEELVKEEESVTTQHRKMVVRTAMVTTVKLRSAMNNHVLVSLCPRYCAQVHLASVSNLNLIGCACICFI